MTNVLKLTKMDPRIHVKAYGSVQIFGFDEPEVHCDIKSSQLATLVEKDGQVFVTANASCVLKVPLSASIEIEKVMGSAKITAIENKIEVSKVFGNLVLLDIGTATVEKVGGNFSVRKAAGNVQVEKVAGNLTVEDVAAFICERVGGNCRIKNISGNFNIYKAGGKFVGQSIQEFSGDSKIGGSYTAHKIQMAGELNVGGKIKLRDVRFSDDLQLKAGGSIDVVIDQNQTDVHFKLRSGDEKIRIKNQGELKEHMKGTYDFQIGSELITVTMAAGGSILLSDENNGDQDVVGDLSDEFDFEESAFSEMIRDRVESATKMAEAKVKSAEIHLEQIRERLEEQRGIDLDFGFGESEKRGRSQGMPISPVKRPVGKKGATDEERLMILQMLQDKKISVEEAEKLFRALEE